MPRVGYSKRFETYSDKCDQQGISRLVLRTATVTVHCIVITFTNTGGYGYFQKSIGHKEVKLSIYKIQLFR